MYSRFTSAGFKAALDVQRFSFQARSYCLAVGSGHGIVTAMDLVLSPYGLLSSCYADHMLRGFQQTDKLGQEFQDFRLGEMVSGLVYGHGSPFSWPRPAFSRLGLIWPRTLFRGEMGGVGHIRPLFRGEMGCQA